MSDSTKDQQDTVMQSMMTFGQSMARQFFEFMAQQRAAMKDNGSVAVDSLPLPDTETLTHIQQEFSRRHLALWTSMIQRKPGEAGESVIEPAKSDRRFKAPEWTESPIYDYLRQAYLLNSQYLQQISDAIPLADGRVRSRMQFLTRQYIDAWSPANFAATNPEFIKAAVDSKGESITRGIQNLLGDLERGHISMTDESAFEVGRNLAVTPGAVIYENELMQLIQYVPQTEQVSQKPLLMVPPCINKYYILDLQQENSLVRYLVEQGLTVFMISWKNATMAESHFTWDDYLEMGPLKALEIVTAITRVKKPNVLGFCVGGTILSSALAILRARGEDPVESVTLMATLLDFADPGEIGCLVDEASVVAREAAVGKKGLMFGQELANVFSALRANDLIWQYVSGNYLKGNTPSAFDLLYWNCDSANLPGPFIAWYLRNMYLENNLRVPGKLKMLGSKVDLGKIEAPAYVLATREDHIVPWHSAYLARGLLGGESTFVLGASGHIAGIVNPPSKNKRSYWTSDSTAANPEEWLESATEHPGSWWTHWIAWLKPLSGKEVPARVKLGNATYKEIEPAPGRYVKEKASAV